MKFPDSLSCICVAIFATYFLWLRLLAGAEGFEPPKAVLETAGLPLAYAPKTAKPFFSFSVLQFPGSTIGTKEPFFSLLDFLMGLMLAAKRTELAELQPLRFGLLVLGLAIVLPLALSAL